MTTNEELILVAVLAASKTHDDNVQAALSADGDVCELMGQIKPLKSRLALIIHANEKIEDFFFVAWRINQRRHMLPGWMGRVGNDLMEAVEAAAMLEKLNSMGMTVTLEE